MKKTIWGMVGAIVIGLATIAGISLAGNGTITVFDSTGATKTYSVVTDGSGNFVGRSVLCDFTAAANCAAVSAGNALSANVAQINGVTPLMGNGATGTGALRVSIANDSTGIVSLTTGASVIGSLAANQSTNEAQINGVAVTMGNGISGTGVQRVTIASDSTGILALTTSSAVIGHVICDSGCASAPTTGFSSAVTLTRTADTNAYTAGDVLGAATGSTAAINFTTIGPSGGEVTLTSASLEVDIAAVPTGMTTFRLYLYNVTPPSAFGDNAAWTGITAADRASYLGYVDLGTPVAVGTSAATLYVQSDNINKQIKLSGTGVFGYLVTNGAYTPTSAAVQIITLHFMALN